MSLRSSGIWCDVCNEVMLAELFLPDRKVNSFKLSCSPNMLHAHDKCIGLVEPACTSEDETLLPPGPLRELIRKVKEHNSKLEPKRLEQGGERGE